MRFLAAAALGLTAWAQTGLERPAPGMMLDVDGAVRPVYGVAGSLTPGDQVATGVLSYACSRTMCLWSAEAPQGPALFAIDGEAAWIYYPQSKQLARWHAGQLDYQDFAIDGEVLSLRAAAGSIEFAVRRENGVWIVRDGGVIDSVPEAVGPVMLLENGVVFAKADVVVLRRPDGTELSFEVQDVEAFFRLGEDYVQVRATGLNYALRIESGREQIFSLAASGQLALLTFDGKTETPTGSVYEYGSVAQGQVRNVRFRARNTGSSAVVLRTLSVAGAGFSMVGAPSTPFTVAPGNFLEFTVRFSGTVLASYSASLQVNTINVILLATVVPPAPLKEPVPPPAPVTSPPCTPPKPSLILDSTTVSSGEQHTLKLTVGTPAPCAASGYVSLAFKSGTNMAADDAAVVFIAVGARTLPYSIKANDTQASINGQPTTVFQTGTTAGSITFLIDGNPVTTLTIPPAVISIDKASASNQRLGNLDINVTGFDNTYSAGPMSFTFFDASGQALAPGAIDVDFTSAFKTFFTGQKSGSAFLMRVSFEVKGDQKQVSSVTVKFSNAAGQTQAGGLTFQ